MTHTTFPTREEPREARGRNGWFTPSEIDVRPDSTDGVRISVRSTRQYGDMPPIFLRISAADARALARALVEAAK